MFELTNDQRKCFGLRPVESRWTRMELKPSPYDRHTTLSYLDGTILRKVIETGDNIYKEYEICEQLSEDLRYLLPKTAKGKPVLLSSATLVKRTGLGMCLSWLRHNSGYSYIDLYSHTSQKCYYSNSYEIIRSYGKYDFQQWVEDWCSDTSEEDLLHVARFAEASRQHIKYREGDVFRFKINRRLYGYGRLLLDYNQMKKRGEPFWNTLAGKSLVCSIYRIATERDDVSVDELKDLPSLPSFHMMDNRLYYGDFQIIGNIPIGESEDYPIMYGNSIDARYRAVLLQCGKLYRRDDSCTALFRIDFKNNVIGFTPKFKLPVLLECIEKGSNDPYWDNQKLPGGGGDLRNPKFRKELEQICKQFGIEPAQLIPQGRALSEGDKPS